MSLKLSKIPLLILPVLMACSDDSGEATPDMGMAAPDAMMVEPDTGVRAKCPLAANNPTCSEISECLRPGDILTRSSNCGDFCPGFKSEPCGQTGDFCPLTCITGQCEILETLENNLNLTVDIAALTGTVEYFVLMVLDAETSGGNTITCADVMQAPETFFNDPCYSVTDVRTSDAVGAGGVFLFPFSGLQADRDVIFLVYGFDQPDAEMPPVGLSCTEYTVPSKDTVLMEPVGASNMMRLQ